MEIEESWDDEWSDVEYYDDDEYDDGYDDDDSETVACPACGTDVYEDAEQCPSCGEYIIASSSGSAYLWKDRPVWWIVLGLGGILAMLYALVFQFM